MKSLTYCINKLIRVATFRRRPHTTAVILAGGSGTRMGKAGGPAKQWIELEGRTVLEHSVLAFERCPYIDEIIVVVRSGETKKTVALLKAAGVRKLRAVVVGGDSRQRSAYNGARRASEETKFIALHDAARCLITPGQIADVVSAAYAHRAASLGTPITDTVKRVGAGDYVKETLNREELWLATTPQVFAYSMYMFAAVSALRDGVTVTDDNRLIERVGQRVRMIQSGGENPKITHPADLERATMLLRMRSKSKETR